MTSEPERDVASALAGGAALSLVRLVAVVAAGLAGTVLLARFLGPEHWGVYTAAWSATLLLVAVLVHGVRDHLVGTSGAAASASASRVAPSLAATAFVLSASVATITWNVLPADEQTTHIALLLGSLVIWATTYALRLPATVHVVRAVLPWRVMTIESLDAVLVPLLGIAAYALAFEDLRAMSVGVLGSAAVGSVLALSWRSPTAAASEAAPPHRTVADARHLTAFQLAAVGRELAIPPLVLLSAGATAAGAFGIALPLGALVSLALAVTAQPAYGAAASMAHDRPRVARLTNHVSALLGAVLTIGVPLMWLATPWIMEQLYGAAWTFATDTVMIVLTVYAVNAFSVPWVNAVMLEHALHRGLGWAQALVTVVVLGAALVCESIGGIEAVALVFLAGQCAFVAGVSVLARRAVPGIRLTSALWFAVAAGAGILVAQLDSPARWMAVPAGIVVLAITPARSHVRAAVRRLVAARA